MDEKRLCLYFILVNFLLLIPLICKKNKDRNYDLSKIILSVYKMFLERKSEKEKEFQHFIKCGLFEGI